MSINIGEKIKLRAKELRVGPTEFARLISSTKQNIYNIYGRKSIDTQLLQNISKALDFDFFRYYISFELNFINEKSPTELAIRYAFEKPTTNVKSAKIEAKTKKELASIVTSMNQKLEEMAKELYHVKNIINLIELDRKK